MSAAAVPDAVIEAEWASAKAVTRAMIELPEEAGAEWSAHMEQLGQHEQTIVTTRAQTLRGAEIQLWVALSHSDGWGHYVTGPTERVLADENADQLAASFADFDFDAKSIVAALLAIRSQEG